MLPISQAVLRTGLVDDAMVAELRRFGAILPEEEPVKDTPLEDAARVIGEALQRHELVLSRETDLEVVQQYFATEKAGRLNIIVGESVASFDVSYGRLRSGEYIFGWKAESITELLCNGTTYLAVTEQEVEKKVFFKDVRELFFGDFKVFIVCTLSSVE